MIVRNQQDTKVPFLLDMFLLGEEPIFKMYLGEKKLYDNNSITHPLIDEYMNSLLDLGLASLISSLAPYVAGARYKFPILKPQGHSEVEYQIDPNCKYVGFFVPALEGSDDTADLQAYVHNGVACINDSPDTTRSHFFIYTIKDVEENGVTKHYYTPLEGGLLHWTDRSLSPYGVYGTEYNLVDTNTNKVITSWETSKGTFITWNSGKLDLENKSVPVCFKNRNDMKIPAECIIRCCLPIYDKSDPMRKYTILESDNFYIHFIEDETAGALHYVFKKTNSEEPCLVCKTLRDTDPWRTLLEKSNPKVIKGKVISVLLNDEVINYPLIKYKGNYSFIYNLIPDIIYTCQLEDGSLKLISMEGNVRMIEVPDRNLSLEVYNIRDIGGNYRNVSIAYDKLYRGSLLCADNYTSVISNETKEYLKNKLNLDTEIMINPPKLPSGKKSIPFIQSTETFDYSSVITNETLQAYLNYDGPKETILKRLRVVGDQPSYSYVGIDDVDTKNKVKNLFTTVANELHEGNKLYVHCIAGADRTGTAITILLGLCGVEEDELYKLYELTSLSGAGYTRNYCIGGYGSNNIYNFINDIKVKGGKDTLAENFRDYLILNIGCLEEVILYIQESLINNTSYNIQVETNSSTMGSVTGSGSYNYKEEVTIKATPESGYTFVSWLDGSTENPRSIEATKNETYIATFRKLNTYKLTVSSDTTQIGSTSFKASSDTAQLVGSKSYLEGTKVSVYSVSMKPMEYEFDRWEDGVTTRTRSITLNSNLTLKACFKPCVVLPVYEDATKFSNSTFPIQYDKIHPLKTPLVYSIYLNASGSGLGQCHYNGYIFYGVSGSPAILVKDLNSPNRKLTSSGYGRKQLGTISNLSNEKAHFGTLNFGPNKFNEDDEFPALYVSGNSHDYVDSSIKPSNFSTTDYSLCYVYRVTRNGTAFTFEHKLTININTGQWANVFFNSQYMYTMLGSQFGKTSVPSLDLAEVNIPWPTTILNNDFIPGRGDFLGITMYKNYVIYALGSAGAANTDWITVFDITNGNVILDYPMALFLGPYLTSYGTTYGSPGNYMEVEGAYVIDGKLIIGCRWCSFYIADFIE